MKLIGTLAGVTHKNGTKLEFKSTQALELSEAGELYQLESCDVEIQIIGIQPSLEIIDGDESRLEDGVDETEE